MGRKRKKGRGGARAKRQHAAAAPSVALVAALYAVVGAAALVHEVGWTRVARTLLGGDARAVAVALVAILGGLGLGGLYAPRVARRWGALGGFARVEGGAALYAALLPWIAPAMDAVVGAAFRSLGPGPAFTAVSAVIAIVLFAPPSLAMGAGLPLLAEARAAAGRTPRDAGVLYATHAVGGTLGGLLAAFVLLPDLGIPAAVGLASFAQLAVAWVALRLRPSAGGAPAAPVSPKPVRWGGGMPRPVLWLLGAALLAGAATASLQALWTRLATLAVGPSVQGFALVAGVYVLALAVGAGAAAPLAKRVRVPTAVYGGLALTACAATLVGASTIGAWPAIAADSFAAIEPGEGAPWARLAWTLAPPVFVPVALAAAAFPFGVAALERAGGPAPARNVGWLVAAGAAGNVVGVVLITFAAVPAVGLARAVILAALALAAAGLCAAVAGFRGSPRLPPLRGRHAWALVGLCGVSALALVQAPRRFDPAVLMSGPFLYAGSRAPELGDVTFVHHGVDSTVTVRQAGGERLLQIDGKVDASGLGDAPTQILVGALPALLADDPSRSLVIGLGTGVTADAVRSVPGVERVEVAELVDGVRWAAPHFARESGRVLDDPRVVVRPVDGAMLLRHGDERWDVIVSEPSNPWVAGMGDFFAVEAFEAARERLAEAGVVAAWFHVYATDLDIVRSVLASFVDVFPDATLWELVRGQDYMLAGRRGGGPLDLDRLARRLADPAVREHLERAGIADASGLLARLVANGDGIRALAGDARPLSARDGSLEARAARSLYVDASGDALALFAGHSLRAEALAIRANTDDGRALAGALPAALEAGALARSLVVSATAGDEDAALAAGERAVGLLPDDPSIREALATLYLGRGKAHALVREVGPATDALMTVLELDPPPRLRADAYTTLGDLQLAAGAHQRALSRYQAARRLSPSVPLLSERIAECLEALGAAEDAQRERRLAARLRERNQRTR